ncbi:STAS domain-containing protein [Streptomyces olivaceus]|uniref:STAS domain-containing protein n=1 Tax=Streptomyces olivaceus TaxID=47716 RepID=A0ABS7VZW7_STROV|nr:hypothetical protein BC342_34130 [Streptomyces olivaceus]QIP74531.1 anti-sigma factor antagonist [Streptomyces sp. VN1]MBZ6084513.1 STAS domain-containing protein [Streptomyces olivaceus]MBZ6088408.1 STAS domain-containing protein [Streptomyces olivaceus]MBZ6094755.1 STAS domain-containing protein [Streptomyces olivaceus]
MTASPHPRPVTIEPSAGPDELLLSLAGDLDYETADEALASVRRTLEERAGLGVLRLDCRKLDLVDSMGLSVLLQIHRLAGRAGMGFHLDNPGPTLVRLLEITGTYEHLTSPGDGDHP